MEEHPKTSLRRARTGPIVLAVVAAAAGVALYVLRPWRTTPPVMAPASAPAPAPEATKNPDAEGPGTMDPAEARARLETLSSSPLYRRAIGEGDVVRRAAVVVANLAEGVSPRRELAGIAPTGSFSAVARGDGFVIAPKSYARYDAFADVVASIDAGALATVYRALRGPLATAYRALGYPGASVDDAVARALRRVEAAPIREGDVAIVEDGGVWFFRDQKLEDLPEVEKHLLRMGPRNTRRIQEKARELLGALQLPAAPATPGTAR
jgi:Protein of unknown function (DUF3014)